VIAVEIGSAMSRSGMVEDHLTTSRQLSAYPIIALFPAGQALLTINHDLQNFFGALNLHRKMDKLQS
jgi:hypothetical protein